MEYQELAEQHTPRKIPVMGEGAAQTGQRDLRRRVEHNFTYHPPRPGQQEHYQRIREKAKELAHVILDETPESREQSIALTDLEKVVMMANAAIARKG
jgi:hypothetical protein